MEALSSQIQAILSSVGPEAALKAAQDAVGKAGDDSSKIIATVAVAECQLGCGNVGEAGICARQAMSLAASAKDKQGEAIATLAAANAALFEDPAEAVVLAEKAKGMFVMLKDKKGQGRAALTLANGESVSEKARLAAKEASLIFREIGDKPAQAAALHTVMNLEAAMYGPEAGLTAAQNALRYAKDIGSRRGEVATLNCVADMHHLKDDKEQALKAAKDAVALAKELPGGSAAKSALASLFEVDFAASDPQEAASYASQAMSVFSGQQDAQSTGHMLLMLATAELKQGQSQAALQHAQQALGSFRDLKDRPGVLAALRAVVTAYANSKPVEPLLMLETAKGGVTFFTGLGDKQGTGAALHLVAAVQYFIYTKKGEPKAAKQAAEAALAFYRAEGDHEGQVAVQTTMIAAGLAKGLPEEALKSAKDLLSLYQDWGDKRGEAKTLDAMANIHIAKDNGRKAMKVAQEALAIATSLGDTHLQLDILSTLSSVHFVRKDGEAALSSAQELLAIFQRLGDKAGEAGAFVLVFRVHQLMGQDEEAVKAAYDALSIMRDLGNKRGQLKVTEYICMALQGKQFFGEAAEVAQEALMLAREMELKFSEGCAMYTMGKCGIASQEGLNSVYEASTMFKALGRKKHAAIALHAVANGILLTRAPARDALGVAGEGLNLYQELGDKKGEAIMMHTIANAQLAMREYENAVNTAYEALYDFEKCGDSYGMDLSRKFLLSCGQSMEEIQERREYNLSTWDGVESKGAVVSNEERLWMEEEARDLQDSQVLWELTFVPWDTQDPKAFGEKYSGGARHVFVTSELQNKSLLGKLMKARPAKSAPAAGTPYFSNMVCGRLLNKDTLQMGMKESMCLSVVYDVSKLNHMGPLEIIDLVLKLVQALVPIEERKIGLDMITTTCQQLAYTRSLREPFHATLWGFSRAARMENPMHEFRMLDIDAGTREDNMAFICRYLTGAQMTRPAEAVVRNGGLFVSRLVGSRSKLDLPFKVELETH